MVVGFKGEYPKKEQNGNCIATLAEFANSENMYISRPRNSTNKCRTNISIYLYQTHVQEFQ